MNERQIYDVISFLTSPDETASITNEYLHITKIVDITVKTREFLHRFYRPRINLYSSDLLYSTQQSQENILSSPRANNENLIFSSLIKGKKTNVFNKIGNLIGITIKF